MRNEAPQIKTMELTYRGKAFDIEYFHREGDKGTILLLHGLGGAKENYWEACKSPSLKGFTLICPDNPGTGNSTYDDNFPLDVDDLANITCLFIDQLEPEQFILVGTSMGGLTALLYLRGTGASKVKAFINIEGNLMTEDCMFSSKVVAYDLETFAGTIFPETISNMRNNGNAGFRIIANNLQLNTSVSSYYHYSFQTVAYSSSGELLEQYLCLDIPRLFIYGEENKQLSYLPLMLEKGMNVKEISESNHFVFYDHPKELYEVIGIFIERSRET